IALFSFLFVLIYSQFIYGWLDPFEDSIYPITVILYVILFQIYFFIAEYLTKGFTLGKYFLNIKIVSNYGSLLGLIQLLIRSLTKVVLFIPPLFVLNELYLFIAFKKKFSDHFSNTEITSVPKKIKSVIDNADRKFIDPELQNEMSVELSPLELNLLKAFYRDAKFLNNESRQSLLTSILQNISDKILLSTKDISAINPQSLLINIVRQAAMEDV
ncbi:MAG: RDD family protein, partial [Bacteroidetes bacterium]|nr:RDD family protein [Bacteroidota bacterium]